MAPETKYQEMLDRIDKAGDVLDTLRYTLKCRIENGSMESSKPNWEALLRLEDAVAHVNSAKAWLLQSTG